MTRYLLTDDLSGVPCIIVDTETATEYHGCTDVGAAALTDLLNQQQDKLAWIVRALEGARADLQENIEFTDPERGKVLLLARSEYLAAIQSIITQLQEDEKND